MNNKYNEIVFCRDQYDNEKFMWEDILSTIKVLTNLNYEMQFYCDELGLGIYCLKFNPRDSELGYPHIEWLENDEYIEKANCDNAEEN